MSQTLFSLRLRVKLKNGLAKCTDKQKDLFKLMYCCTDLSLSTNINEVVDKMPENQLEWALKQVQNTIKTFEIEQSELEENKKPKDIWDKDINNLTGLEI